MFEVLQLTLIDLTQELVKLRRLHDDSMSHIGATDEIWATIIEDFPEMIPSIIKDMRFRAAKIRELTGVTLNDNI